VGTLLEIRGFLDCLTEGFGEVRGNFWGTLGRLSLGSDCVDGVPS